MHLFEPCRSCHTQESCLGIGQCYKIWQEEMRAANLRMGGEDNVNHPKHYNSLPNGVECIDVAENFNYNLGNSLKYIWRADLKGNPIEDLRKAIWYIEREIERRGKLESEG